MIKILKIIVALVTAFDGKAAATPKIEKYAHKSDIKRKTESLIDALLNKSLPIIFILWLLFGLSAVIAVLSSTTPFGGLTI